MTTQLRKILFSAFVYGALVIVCLGGVVWGLSFALPNVLPIHYSSNEPVLEFPIDLLFYNFLMPLAVKVFKPSDGLHVMYTWWFRRCARALRLTWFLFGERRIDEEGTLYLPDSPEMRALPWWRKLFVEIDENGAVVPKSWKNTFDSGKPSAHQARKLQASELKELHEKKQVLIKENRLKPSGRFVRTPASDQVKIPKGRKVFLEVSPENERLDGDKDRPDSDLYSSPQYQFVYIPPHFRLRIFLFILFIWLFAAVTGVGITIVPLIFGRRMFKMLIPEHVRTNDIYAFSIGIYILGSAAYSIYHARTILNKIRQRADENLTRLLDRYAIRQAALLVQKAAQLVYSYAVLTVVLPALVAALVEFYVVLPLHTYMYPPSLRSAVDGQGDSGVSASAPETHTMHAVQAWTLGILYLKLLARGITYFHNGSRLAGAVRAVMRNGWLDPDARVLTRAFLVPGLAVAAVALALPLVAADLFIRACEITDPADRVLIYRNAFPANLGLALAAASAWMVVSVFESWKTRIRDEAYLIGERLHNFGVGAATNMSGRGASGRMGEWRAGANRL